MNASKEDDETRKKIRRRKKRTRTMMMMMKNDERKGKQLQQVGGDQEMVIRKGPWKAEEDDVLLSHVKKHGPRDWSSIRSKGLLLRTGKSCRLRWVNKLRPNLKNGCKFTADEERVVIELQAEFGNKWARIATHLPGRTDNDVKNFWSSRRKRLARLSHNSSSSSPAAAAAATATSSSSSSPARATTLPSHSSIVTASASAKSHRMSNNTSSFSQAVVPAPNQLHVMQAPAAVRCPLLEDDSSLMIRPLPSSSSLVGTPLFAPLHCKPELLSYDDSHLFAHYHLIPQPQPEMTFPADSQELLLPKMEDPYFYGMFGPVAPELGDAQQLSLPGPVLDPTLSCADAPRGVKSSATPDTFFDDFPEDMFDPIQPLPSPPEW